MPFANTTVNTTANTVVQPIVNEKLMPYIPVKYQDSSECPVFEYELPVAAKCITWGNTKDDGVVLVVGHDMGLITLTTEPDTSRGPNSEEQDQNKKWALKRIHKHLGQPVDMVRYRNEVTAAVHPSHSLSILYPDVNSLDEDGKPEVVLYHAAGCHESYINSIDISSNGTVASTSDDLSVIIYAKYPKRDTYAYRLQNRGLQVRFWEDASQNRLLVLESGNKVRILDYNRGSWLVTIYPGMDCGLTRNLGIFQNNVLITGSGWWKAYDPMSLSGGCGYTKPLMQGTLLADGLKSSDKKLQNSRRNQTVVSINNGRFVANLSTKGYDVYDLEQSSEYGAHIEHDFPGQITDCSLSENGLLLAAICRKTLAIYRTRTTSSNGSNMATN